jgi:predicted PurR-regulated permease PerM
MVLKKIQKFARKAQKKYEEIKKSSTQPVEETVPKPVVKKVKIEKRLVRISLGDITKAILIAILLGTLGYLVYQIKDIIIIFFVSLLFATALDPTIDRLQRFRIPRSISVIIIFILLITGFVLFIGNLIPILSKELLDLGLTAQNLINNLLTGKIEMPGYLEWLNPIIQDTFGGVNTNSLTTNLQNYLIQFGEELRSVAGNAFKTLIAISNGLGNAILVLLLTYFMIVDEVVIDKFVLSLFPKKYGPYITAKSGTIKKKVGEWLRGQIILMFAVGILTYIGLVLIGVEYAFTLGIFAGVTELIPVIGPIIGLIAAIPIAANQSGEIVIAVIILYFVIQRLENNLLVPMIMKQATGLHPIIVLFVMLVGFEFMGILGIIISVPVAAVGVIFLEDYLKRDK